MDVSYSPSLDNDESYSQVIMMMMMMVVTGTEMPHIETRIPFPQSFFFLIIEARATRKRGGYNAIIQVQIVHLSIKKNFLYKHS